MICQICKKKDRGFRIIIEGHHIIPERFEKKNTRKIDLCLECHVQLHAFYSLEAMKIALKLDKEFFYKCRRLCLLYL